MINFPSLSPLFSSLSLFFSSFLLSSFLFSPLSLSLSLSRSRLFLSSLLFSSPSLFRLFTRHIYTVIHSWTYTSMYDIVDTHVYIYRQHSINVQVKKALARLRNRVKSAVWSRWEGRWRQMRKVKALISRGFFRAMTFSFKIWRQYLYDCRLDKKIAATKMQGLFRGKKGRSYAQQQVIHLLNICVDIDRIIM